MRSLVKSKNVSWPRLIWPTRVVNQPKQSISLIKRKSRKRIWGVSADDSWR